MKAFTSSTIANPQNAVQVFSEADYEDLVTISFQPFTGSLGYVLPIFVLTGSATSNTPAAHAVALVHVFSEYTNGDQGTIQDQLATGNTVMVFKPIPFHFGQPFALGSH